MDSIIILRSYWESIKHLNPKTRQEFLEAIVMYGLESVEPNFTGLELSLWISIKSSMDSNVRRYQSSVENGKKGGAPKGNSNAKKQPKTTQEQPTLILEQPKNNLNKDKDMDKDKNKDMDMDKDMDKDKAVKKNLFEHIPNFITTLEIPKDTKEEDIVDRYLDDLLRTKMS